MVELNDEIHALGINTKFVEVAWENSSFVKPADELKQNSDPGHDVVTEEGIKNVKHNIIQILTKLVNTVLKTGRFPDEWK